MECNAGAHLCFFLPLFDSVLECMEEHVPRPTNTLVSCSVRQPSEVGEMCLPHLMRSPTTVKASFVKVNGGDVTLMYSD